MKTVAYSATGYSLMLATGSFAGVLLGSGDSFAGLGLAAMIAATLAPLAGATGAALGLMPHRKLRLVGGAARLSAVGFGFAVVAPITAWVWIDVLSAVATGLLGLTAALILRAALLEMAEQN